jgi:hypothetical protein
MYGYHIYAEYSGIPACNLRLATGPTVPQTTTLRNVYATPSIRGTAEVHVVPSAHVQEANIIGCHGSKLVPCTCICMHNTDGRPRDQHELFVQQIRILAPESEAEDLEAMFIVLVEVHAVY